MQVNYDSEFFATKIIPRISRKPILLTGVCALSYLGVSASGIFEADVLVTEEKIGGLRIPGRVNYHYVPVVDLTHYVTPFRDLPKVFIPTKERAFVELIKYNLEFIDEGYFCDALENYERSKEYNRELLIEVANYFEVPMDKVDYWIAESDGYNNMGN